MIKIHYNGNVVYTSDGNSELSSEEARLIGNRQKKFILRYKHYRQISSSAAYMFDNRVNQIVFYTFTIKENMTDNSVTNPAFSYALRRLKKDYGLNSYIWVVERQKRGAIHYHCLFDMPYVKYSELKRVWHEVGSKFGIEISRQNSVSGSKGRSAVVKNVEQAVKYLTKYMAKGINGKNNQTFEGRVYAISRNVNVKPRVISVDTALKYANTQVREPFVNGLGLVVQFVDLQVVREDWEDIKAIEKRVNHAEKLRTLKEKITCTRREAVRSEMYNSALNTLYDSEADRGERGEAMYTLRSIRAARLPVGGYYSYYIGSFSAQYLQL